MMAVLVKFPSTTKSCGMESVRQLESSVDGWHDGSVHPPGPGPGGGGGSGLRALLFHVFGTGLLQPLKVPIQQLGEGEHDAPGGHH